MNANTGMKSRGRHGVWYGLVRSRGLGMKLGLRRDFFVVEGVVVEEDGEEADVVAVGGVMDARDSSALKSALSSSRAVAVVVDAWESAVFSALL